MLRSECARSFATRLCRLLLSLLRLSCSVLSVAKITEKSRDSHDFYVENSCRKKIKLFQEKNNVARRRKSLYDENYEHGTTWRWLSTHLNMRWHGYICRAKDMESSWTRLRGPTQTLAPLGASSCAGQRRVRSGWWALSPLFRLSRSTFEWISDLFSRSNYIFIYFLMCFFLDLVLVFSSISSLSDFFNTWWV